jgi:ribonuclease HII
MKASEREIYLQEKLVEMSVYENELHANGYKFIAGIDEVGRGPLAGPVCAAAVVLPEGFAVLGVDDSKKLSEKKRDVLYEQILSVAVTWGIGLVDHSRIDEINILNATKEAMYLAISDANSKLAEIAGQARNDASEDNDANDADYNEDASLRAPSRNLSSAASLRPPRRNLSSAASLRPPRRNLVGIDYLLVDALELPDAGIPGKGIIKGDAKSVSIAAASIVAKVTRDRMMIKFDEVYPGYGFAKNKGYGTKAHYEGLRLHGITPIHRRTFLK